ncbi:hypothetical protein CHCC20327_2584 [Bacillus licheniformis]|nr:hypothetical protein CHCC20327_2584 [Bacillus licheniformis]
MPYKEFEKKELDNKPFLLPESRSQNTLKVLFLKKRDDSILSIPFLLFLCINLNVAVTNLPILDQKILITL